MKADDVWPAQDIETVGHCPACGSSERRLMYGGMTDIVFGCAPGKWTMHECTDCASGYLDPRPDQKSIGRAYAVYYTHGAEGGDGALAKLRGFPLLARAINGRLNALYGLKREPASVALGMALRCLPFVQHIFDPDGRSLSKPPFAGARLLDYGCGDGRFLRFAKEMGWQATGVDFDQKAVDIAKSQGLDVRLGGWEMLGSHERFDAITLSHVIEHVHDPAETFRLCFDRLNPGGELVMETPNIQSYGRARFGVWWRGMECPRHLVILSRKSITNLYKSSGFAEVRYIPRAFVSLSTYPVSRNTMTGNASAALGWKKILSDFAALADGFRAVAFRDKAEFLKVSGRKPLHDI